MVYYIASGVLSMFFWCPCMAINVSIKYNGGLLQEMIILTQRYYHWGTRSTTSTLWLCIYSLSILPLPCVMAYYIVYGVLLMLFSCPCMTINVSIQYNGGFLPDIILLTQCYFHQVTRLNAMKVFLICSL